MESSLRTDVAGRVDELLPSLRTEVAGLVEEDEFPLLTEVEGLEDELFPLLTEVAGLVEDELLPEVPLVEEGLSEDTCFAAPPVTGVTRRCPDGTVVPVVLSEDGGVRLAEDAAELRSSCLPVLRDVLDCEEDEVEVCLEADGV